MRESLTMKELKRHISDIRVIMLSPKVTMARTSMTRSFFSPMVTLVRGYHKGG